MLQSGPAEREDVAERPSREGGCGRAAQQRERMWQSGPADGEDVAERPSRERGCDQGVN